MKSKTLMLVALSSFFITFIGAQGDPYYQQQMQQMQQQQQLLDEMQQRQQAQQQMQDFQNSRTSAATTIACSFVISSAVGIALAGGLL